MPRSSGVRTARPSTETITSPSPMPTRRRARRRACPPRRRRLSTERSCWNRRSAVIACGRDPEVAGRGKRVVDRGLDRVAHEVDLDREPDVLRLVVAGGVDADDRPCMSTSGPPELPGLIAASVWITLGYVRTVTGPAGSAGLAGIAVRVLHLDRAVERRHDAGGHGRPAFEPEGVAERDDALAQPEPRGVTERHGRQALLVDLEDGEVVQAVGADQPGLVLGAVLVGEEDGEPGSALDHVTVRDDDAVGADDEAGADALARAAVGLVDVGRHVHDRRKHPVDDVGDGLLAGRDRFGRGAAQPGGAVVASRSRRRTSEHAAADTASTATSADHRSLHRGVPPVRGYRVPTRDSFPRR